MKPIPNVAEDFDRIATVLALSPLDTPFTRAEQTVLRAIPSEARSVLDVGCGDGRISRELAARGFRVTAIDVAPRMIALAQNRQPRLPIDYRVADIMTNDAPPGTFDVVVSVNVVHHLPIELIVPRLVSHVGPGGTLIIQDVVDRSGARYLPINVVAALRSRFTQVLRPSRVARRTRRLYEEHGRGEVYLQRDAVEQALTPILPGVRITHHLEWRYTAIWTRPEPHQKL